MRLPAHPRGEPRTRPRRARAVARHRGESRATDAVAVSWLRRARVGRWVHFLALPLAGVDVHGGVPAVLAAARGVLVAFMVLAFGYTLNSLADRRMDHPAKNAFATSTPPLTSTLLASLAVAALIASSGAPLAARAATLVALVSGVLYSV